VDGKIELGWCGWLNGRYASDSDQILQCSAVKRRHVPFADIQHPLAG
jgi:hypothetical protein